MDFTALLAQQFSTKTEHVDNIIQLIDEGNTIPFIARYRKELTGSMDDQVLRELSERLQYLRNFDKRRSEIKTAIDEQGVMTDEINKVLEDAQTLSELEDIYRPYKPKRKTRASMAKEKGLEPLANEIFVQLPTAKEPLVLAAGYQSEEKGVLTPEDALAGAMDIIAEKISDDASIRRRLRVLYHSQGMLQSKKAKDEDSVYALYYEFSEQVSKLAGHRILAINRGEKEEFLKVSVSLEEAKAMHVVCSVTVKEGSTCTETVREAAYDAYHRLIAPSIEREIRNELTERASADAIKVFSMNLRQLLMQPPVKGNTALGLDPGYRTGCKVAVVDSTGKVLDTGVIYPTVPYKKTEESKKIIKGLIAKHKISVIAIGNGTASKETEIFAAEIIQEIGGGVSYMVVSEAGASVYSASKLAAAEFPEYDVSLRSAVSIARRMQDPLAELVKIDPKAIGVGQYQHDMPPKQLDEALVGVVEDCVNNVGVDLNTASPSLLQRVSGINATISKEIVSFREQNGAFTGRTELKKVPKLGPKAFEQCAGFLRVAESKNVLDNTAVHPESYHAAKTLLMLCGYTLEDVKTGNISALGERVEQLGLEECANRLSVGVPTLCDIIAELQKPGRDPRDELPKPMLRTDILDMKDLKPGMELTGTVRNVIDFGAFVDIGVDQDGLVHISELCNRYIKHPSEAVKVGDIVKVWVLGVDVQKKRISLTMKQQ